MDSTKCCTTFDWIQKWTSVDHYSLYPIAVQLLGIYVCVQWTIVVERTNCHCEAYSWQVNIFVTFCLFSSSFDFAIPFTLSPFLALFTSRLCVWFHSIQFLLLLGWSRRRQCVCVCVWCCFLGKDLCHHSLIITISFSFSVYLWLIADKFCFDTLKLKHLIKFDWLIYCFV